MIDSTHIQVSEDTRDMLVAMAEAEGVSPSKLVDKLLKRLVELDRRPRFPLNEIPGDFSDICGRPIALYDHGTSYYCEHGHHLLMPPNGRPVFLSDGTTPTHWCDFKPRP